MDGLSSWDVALFHWINRDWSHPALDLVMRFLSGNPFFAPGLAVLAVVLIWRDHPRGLVFVLMLASSAALANALVADPLKHLVERQRPYAALTDVVLRVGRGNPLGGMPSAHAMNSALIATVAGWYYRRSILWVGPVAIGVAFSRVYNGAHFPTDVLAGMALGAASGGLFLVVAERVWRTFAPRWIPGAARRVPSLLRPSAPPGDQASQASQASATEGRE